MASVVVCAITGMSFGRIGCGRIAAVTYGIAGGIVGLLAAAWQVPVGGLGPGLAFGFTFGLSAGLMAATPKAWGRFVMYRVFLASRGRQPWRLMSFLDDAHKRGVLRQAGAVYQFRHIELQQRLAIRLDYRAIQPETAGKPKAALSARPTFMQDPGQLVPHNHGRKETPKQGHLRRTESLVMSGDTEPRANAGSRA